MIYILSNTNVYVYSDSQYLYYVDKNDRTKLSHPLRIGRLKPLDPAESSTVVLLPRPFILEIIIGTITKGHELLRMVTDELHHDLFVVERSTGIGHDLLDVMLIRRYRVRTRHPLKEITFGHRPALGVHTGIEMYPALREVGAFLPMCGDELIFIHQWDHLRNPRCIPISRKMSGRLSLYRDCPDTRCILRREDIEARRRHPECIP